MPGPLAMLGGAATTAFLLPTVKDIWNSFGGDFGGQAGRAAKAMYTGLAPGLARQEIGLETDLLRARGQRAGLIGQATERAMPGPGPEHDLGVQMFLREATQPYSQRLGEIAAVQQAEMDPVTRELMRMGVRF